MLSIPFIGIFALHLLLCGIVEGQMSRSFNSLYWDFCFASPFIFWIQAFGYFNFQFPLLGFLLCIFALIVYALYKKSELSIPFIGIFALHPGWLSKV